MKHLQFRIISIAIVFLGIICFPLINGQLSLFTDNRNFENRRYAQKPEFRRQQADSFPGQFENYYNDHFFLRPSLVTLYTIYNTVLFKKSPFPHLVIIGRHGWLYPANDELAVYQGKEKLGVTEMEGIRKELEKRRQYLAQHNCKFYVLIAPCKANVYPENIGLQYYRFNDEAMGQQLIAYLNGHNSVKPVNAFEALRREKKETPLYFKLDNHWNSLGAFYSANAFFKQVHADFTNVNPLALENYDLKKTEKHSGNLQLMIGGLDIFKETDYELVAKHGMLARTNKLKRYPAPKDFPYPWLYELRREIPGSSQPSLLIITDSFGEGIFPFLSENFSHTVKLFDDWKYELARAIVEKEKPDAMLLIIHEKNLRKLLVQSTGL